MITKSEIPEYFYEHLNIWTFETINCCCTYIAKQSGNIDQLRPLYTQGGHLAESGCFACVVHPWYGWYAGLQRGFYVGYYVAYLQQNDTVVTITAKVCWISKLHNVFIIIWLLGTFWILPIDIAINKLEKLIAYINTEYEKMAHSTYLTQWKPYKLHFIHKFLVLNYSTDNRQTEWQSTMGDLIVYHSIPNWPGLTIESTQ